MNQTNDPAPIQPPDFIDLPPDPPAWPKVIGIISIVFGSLGVMCTGCGGAMLFAMPALLKLSEEQFGPAPDVFKPPVAQFAMIPVGLILAIVLLVAGIMLIRRKPAARAMHLVYAIINTLLNLAGVAVGIAHLQKLAAWKAANEGDQWAAQINMPQQYATMAISVAIGIGYPLFLLIWFGLVKRKATDMGTVPEYL